ncbi:unnamed protein product [Haemonchus placei]|uniref:F-box domain-containing protein n=1 Tax=Haemonchus placei TaxID=6290 RepID=A0A0N4X8K4_HAEPC|nr:unnamed protein product [Haemonchus placei]
MFKALRRLHGQNLESRGLNDMSEAFQSFVSHCSLPREDRRLSMFGTLPKNLKNCGTATLTFKRPEDAEKAKNAAPEELKFYEQFMVVTPFVSRRKGGKGVILTDDSQDETFNLSRASSNQSLASTTMSLSTFEGRSMDDIATSALERIAAYLPVNDTIRMERVSKRCMEASMKSILRRAGVHLKSLDLSGIVHLMDEKALEIIATSCPLLEELDLSGVRASWEALGDLGESLTNLKRLTYRDMDSASDKAFWFLIKGCGRGLHFIDLRGCRRLHGRCFRLFGDRLEQLYLDGCVHVDERAIEDLCTCAAGLKELRLNDCYQITDENLSMISRTMSDLRVFTLCGDRFEKLSSAGLAHISNMTSLTELALDYNPLVDDKFLISICEELKNLKTLSLANAGTDQTLTAKGLAAIAQLKALEQVGITILFFLLPLFTYAQYRTFLRKMLHRKFTANFIRRYNSRSK